MLFGATNPIVFLFMLYNLQVMMNTDLDHLFSITRRPIPRLATSIGDFEYFYLFLLGLSIITNSHLLAFNSKIISTYFGLMSTEDVKNASSFSELGLSETN